MVDMTLSLKVMRAELTLADLELNDHVNFVVVLFGPAARRRRNTYNTSGNAHGGELANSVLDVLVRPLAVRLLGSTQTELDTLTETLIEAFEQSSYQLKQNKNAALTTYDCFTAEQITPAGPDGSAIDTWDPHQLMSFQHVYRLDVPTQPQPATGPI